MCDICKNQVARSYSHSRNSHHKKQLFKIMKERKRTNYYNNNSIPNRVDLSKN